VWGAMSSPRFTLTTPPTFLTWLEPNR